MKEFCRVLLSYKLVLKGAANLITNTVWKSVCVRSFSVPVRILPHSDWIRRDTVFSPNGENTDQKNLEYGQFLRGESELERSKILITTWFCLVQMHRRIQNPAKYLRWSVLNMCRLRYLTGFWIRPWNILVFIQYQITCGLAAECSNDRIVFFDSDIVP